MGSPGPTLQKVRVLVVEDDPPTGHALELLLKHYRYDVSTASTVAAALSHLDAGPPPPGPARPVGSRTRRPSGPRRPPSVLSRRRSERGRGHLARPAGVKSRERVFSRTSAAGVEEVRRVVRNQRA